MQCAIILKFKQLIDEVVEVQVTLWRSQSFRRHSGVRALIVLATATASLQISTRFLAMSAAVDELMEFEEVKEHKLE